MKLEELRGGLKGHEPEPYDKDAVVYLQSVEVQPFSPIGWLYDNVFQELTAKGFTTKTASGYEITDLGLEQLRLWREDSKR